MIASVQGTVQHLAPGEIVLEVGGVGLAVAVPLAVAERSARIGEPMFLHTRLIVREDSLSLYGFETAEERDLFDLLLQVSGVGPRLALSIISHVSLDRLQAAVSRDQPELLSGIPGVGRKTAEKIVFQLRDRVGVTLIPSPELLEADRDVLGVLTTLGYSMVEAQSAVQGLPADASKDVEERVKLALRYLAGR
ncbi:MAG: Holliday junction branch migration protein RuvA [Anaerolineales bacterium]|nr:Holliday junction branch migration protein RuvA [Anaerolineales bacterium]